MAPSGMHQECLSCTQPSHVHMLWLDCNSSNRALHNALSLLIKQHIRKHFACAFIQLKSHNANILTRTVLLHVLYCVKPDKTKLLITFIV